MLDIAKAILDAAKAILGLADQLKTAERQQRAEMADLFDKISACLAATSSEIRAGEIPHGRCGELMMYADSLPLLAMGALGEEKAKALIQKVGPPAGRSGAVHNTLPAFRACAGPSQEAVHAYEDTCGVRF